IPGPNDLGGLSGLFDDGSGNTASPAATPDGQAAPSEPAAPSGPLWPGALDHETCKAVAGLMYKDRNVPPDTNPDMAAAARKVVLGLSSVEREALEKSGPESHLYEALHARMMMAVANAAATRLFASQPPAVVDTPSLTGLVQLADAAAKRLQGEADKAISGGQVESLQMISAASSALSREQLTLKESADRLRGIAAAPRMGAGALDPDVQVPGQGPVSRPLARDKSTEKLEVRAELKDFAGFDESPKAERTKRRLWVALVVFAISLINLFFFANQGAKDASQTLLERAGTGVMHISVAEKTAIVTVTPGWLAIERRAAALGSLCDALRSVKVDRCAIMIDNVGITGQVDVQHDCTPYGLTGGKGLPPGAPPPAPAPGK
ncbi:MAG: hypothetical protein JST92_25855, partial [Deltaproteobacteria bacterium]|nr:hypothetical protein [Deltaproteobacteria bacterium]